MTPPILSAPLSGPPGRSPTDTTLPKAPKSAVRALRGLIAANLRAAASLREAGSTTPSVPLGAYLEGMARNRCALASTLEVHLVDGSDPGPRPGTSLTATLSLIWAHLRLALRGGEPGAVIDHALATEERLEDAYRAALAETAGTPLEALLREHLVAARSDARALIALRPQPSAAPR